MKEETHDINEIIIRYLDGSAELEEKRLLLRWLKQSDDNRDDFIATRDLWLSCNVAAGNELEIDIALGKLKNRILLEQGRMERNLPAKRNTYRWFCVGRGLLPSCCFCWESVMVSAVGRSIPLLMSSCKTN